MILATLLLAPVAFQGHDVLDLRTLAFGRFGRLQTATSSGPAAPYAQELDASLRIGRVKGESGRIVRMWLDGGHMRTRLRVHVDGRLVPEVDERIGMAFEEGRPPFLSVWSFAPGRAAGARVTYAPIPYSREALLTLSSRVDRYEIEFLHDEGFDATNLPHIPKTTQHTIPAIQIAPGETKVLGVVKDGEGMMQELTLSSTRFTDESFSTTRLRIFVDGETRPGIDASLRDLFARPTVKTVFNGFGFVNGENDVKMRLPVPFADGGRIEIQNGGTQPLEIAGNAAMNRDPLSLGMRRLRIREWAGVVKPRESCVLIDTEGAGHFVGFTCLFDKNPKAIQGARLSIEADGRIAYQSVNLASAFDGGSEFGAATYTTVGSGISHVSDNLVMAHCWRFSRAVPFERGLRVTLDGPPEGEASVRGTVLTYMDPPPRTASAASRPANGGDATPATKPATPPE